MEQKTKINLNAIMNSSNNKKDLKTKKIENEENTNLQPQEKEKLSLNKTKDNSGDKNEKISSKKQVLSLNEIEKKKETGNKNEEEIKNEKISPKKQVLSLNEIEKKKETGNKNEEKIKKDLKTEKKIEEKPENKKELFSNYESTFEKEEDTILTKIKKLKNLPKTSPLFLTTIIMITIVGIGFLFYIDPKTHSVQNYKTSILNIVNKNNKIKINKIEKKPIIKEEKIKRGGINFDLTIENLEGKELYKYNGETFNSKQEVENKIFMDLEKIKKDKLKNSLIDKFKQEK